MRIFGAVHGSRLPARATMLARYTDAQGRPLRQRELCEGHADWLRTNRANVHDLKGDDLRNPLSAACKIVTLRSPPTKCGRYISCSNPCSASIDLNRQIEAKC